MKNWAVVRIRFRVTCTIDFMSARKYNYDPFLDTEIIDLFDYEQEAIDYLNANGSEISQDSLVTVVKVEDITQW